MYIILSRLICSLSTSRQFWIRSSQEKLRWRNQKWTWRQEPLHTTMYIDYNVLLNSVKKGFTKICLFLKGLLKDNFEIKEMLTFSLVIHPRTIHVPTCMFKVWGQWLQSPFQHSCGGCFQPLQSLMTYKTLGSDWLVYMLLQITHCLWGTAIAYTLLAWTFCSSTQVAIYEHVCYTAYISYNFHTGASWNNTWNYTSCRDPG